MSFLRFIFFLDVVSLDLPVPSIIAVECAACHRVTRLAEMLWWPCIFKPAFCMLHLCLVKSKKHLGFCCFGLLKEYVQPPLSYIFLSIKTGGDLDVNKCNLHFFTTPPPCFFLRLFCRCFPRFPQGSARDLQSAHVFFGGRESKCNFEAFTDTK